MIARGVSKQGLSVLGAALFLFVGCQSKVDGTAPDGSMATASEGGTQTALQSREPGATDAALSRADATATKLASSEITGLRSSCGSMAVWGVPSGDGTDIIGRRFTEKGAWSGDARLLRHTSGTVSQLLCAVNATESWVAWFSTTKTDSFVATIRSSVDLSVVSRPLTLVQKKAGELLADPDSPASLMMTPREHHGMLIAYPSGRSGCRGPDGEQQPCPEFSVLNVDSPFSSLRADGKRAMSVGPNIQFDALIESPFGVAVSAFGWHGGPVVSNTVFQGNSEPSMELPSCRPPHRMAVVHGALVIVCPGDFMTKGERCPLAHDDLCPRIAIMTPDPHTRRLQGKLKPLTSIESRCTPRREREYKWEGGSVIVLSDRPKFYLPNTETKLAETPCDVD